MTWSTAPIIYKDVSLKKGAEVWKINSLSQDMRSAASLIKFITAEAWH